MRPPPHSTVPMPAQPFEARAALFLEVRRAGVRNLDVLRAIESAPRELFVADRFKPLANRNMALPIGCGQTMPSPADLGRRLEALEPESHHRVFEVGTGSGYGAAVLARLSREVISVERFETLAIEAARRLSAQTVGKALVLFGDGLAPSRCLGEFDRILLHVCVEEAPRRVVDLLAPGGLMLFGRLEPAAAGRRRGARLVRLARDQTGAFRETDLGLCRLGAAVPGSALVL